LRAVDLQGTVTGEWALAAPVNPVSLHVLWCTPDGVFYRADRGKLQPLDLTTDRSQDVLRPPSFEGAKLPARSTEHSVPFLMIPAPTPHTSPKSMV